MDLSFILVGDQDNEDDEEEVFRLEEEVIYLVLGEDQGDYQDACYGMYQNGEDTGLIIFGSNDDVEDDELDDVEDGYYY
ncbi:MAG: hypothetical protein EZS28_048410 [Streblomastix strix]|uniref:Uncharacterized protein n=1 Tax=Streblomastix strix TaxID=222440 RepID=A0A5J4TCE8_9EUKA|nr:MAG: hypothetical protein EZS28_048410 [Streblomastix strix]